MAQPVVSTSAAPRRLDGGDVDLLHRHHRLESALGLSATRRKRLSQRACGDLPGEAPAVLAPTALAFLATIADDRVPVAIRLFLIVRCDLEGKGLAMLELRAAVDTEAGNTQKSQDGDTLRLEYLLSITRPRPASSTSIEGSQVEVNYFRDILVPVIGGLGIFMLGLEFMSDGIQSLAVNRMRELLARIAGTPIKGVLAGTLITGIIQSSTAMTVMVVGLVNSGILALRPAISVIMGANIGTTLGNGLIALPLGPLGLISGGFFALIHVFSRNERVRNIALTCMGFSLIFYGLNLLTGGLRPLRNMPQVMAVISNLNTNTFLGVISCILTAAFITAMIHSSSATIGIVMGLGASGVLAWTTAVAFSLGADLGTTITSWMASLNLTKNAKRAAYAHIAFNLIGVVVMLPLFFPSVRLLTWSMQFVGGDPGVPVLREGVQTFPLVPVAVGIYSIAFNIFNTLLLFPLVGVFERVLSRVGHDATDDLEDYSVPRFIDPRSTEPSARLRLVQQEIAHHRRAVGLFLSIAHQEKSVPVEPKEHHAAVDILGREIRKYTAATFRPDTSAREADLLASVIEEEDFTASLGETLFQVARRVRRQPFNPGGKELVDATLAQIAEAMRTIAIEGDGGASGVNAEKQQQFLLSTRQRCLEPDTGLLWDERRRILELLGSAERAFFLIDRIDAERRSVPRSITASTEAVAPELSDAHPIAAGPFKHRGGEKLGDWEDRS
jgi:phosphate:Na+ symporter